MELKEVLPMDIEKRSMEIIGEELGEVQLDPDKASIVKRVIHTSADFDYARNLRFSEGVVAQALAVLQQGATIVTDTKMACVGINKPGLRKLGGQAVCFTQSNVKITLNSTPRILYNIPNVIDEV